MMRRSAQLAAALSLALAALPCGASAATQDPSLPPHAWLFGTWTGGIFPVPSGLSNQACLSQPVVIFTRDLVLRASLTEQVLTQREIETVRNSSQGAEFRFAAAPGGGSGLLDNGAGHANGFGCNSPDELHVQRRGENEVTFPGCADFPNPLIRCQTR
jgi:hypothetical protein